MALAALLTPAALVPSLLALNPRPTAAMPSPFAQEQTVADDAYASGHRASNQLIRLCHRATKFSGNNALQWTRWPAKRRYAIGKDSSAMGSTLRHRWSQAADDALLQQRSQSIRDQSMAIGSRSLASSLGAVAIGYEAHATAVSTMAIGPLASATAFESMAIGTLSTANAPQTLAMGVEAEASEFQSIAIGHRAKAAARNSFASGTNSTALGYNSLAIGVLAKTTSTANDGVAIGVQSVAAENAPDWDKRCSPLSTSPLPLVQAPLQQGITPHDEAQRDVRRLDNDRHERRRQAPPEVTLGTRFSRINMPAIP